MKSFREVNKQLNREALYTVILFALFFVWWYVCAYGLADATWTVLGLPAWFFMSCVVGWILCCIGVAILVKKGFHNIDLDAYSQIEDKPAAGREEGQINE